MQTNLDGKHRHIDTVTGSSPYSVHINMRKLEFLKPMDHGSEFLGILICGNHITKVKMYATTY